MASSRSSMARASSRVEAGDVLGAAGLVGLADGLVEQVVEALLPPGGPVEQQPAGLAHVVAVDRVAHPLAEGIVVVEHPPGPLEGPARELPEREERPQRGRGRHRRHDLEAGPRHDERRLERRAQQRDLGLVQLPGSPRGAASEASAASSSETSTTERPLPHQRHATSSTTSSSTSVSSTSSWPPTV